MAQCRHAMQQDAAAHQEHGRRAQHRQGLHQPRREGQDAASQGLNFEYRDVPAELGAMMYERYLEGAGVADRAAFAHAYAVLGAQRNLRIVGVFARLDRRDGKAHYLPFMDRVWGLVARDLRHPALDPVAEWLDRHSAAWRTRPPARCRMARSNALWCWRPGSAPGCAC
jgi:hypothetical protein